MGLAPGGENERESAMVDDARTLPSTVTLMGEELNARGRAAANRRAGFARVRSMAMPDFYSLEISGRSRC